LTATLFAVGTNVIPAMAADTGMLLDDRASGSLDTPLGTRWQLLTDTVMGGVSHGRLDPAVVEDRECLRLTGEVSLENSGGFVQAALDLAPVGWLDARGYQGIELEVFGNGEDYNLHLRTADTRVVWQSYRATFGTEPRWQRVRLPFAAFAPYRIDRPLDLAKLRRIGVVAIGREMLADLCIGRVGLYREA
jgi:hypothetical protein